MTRTEDIIKAELLEANKRVADLNLELDRLQSPKSFKFADAHAELLDAYVRVRTANQTHRTFHRVRRTLVRRKWDRIKGYHPDGNKIDIECEFIHNGYQIYTDTIVGSSAVVASPEAFMKWLQAQVKRGTASAIAFSEKMESLVVLQDTVHGD